MRKLEEEAQKGDKVQRENERYDFYNKIKSVLYNYLQGSRNNSKISVNECNRYSNVHLASEKVRRTISAKLAVPIGVGRYARKCPDSSVPPGTNVSSDIDGNGRWFKGAISASDVAMWNLKFFIPPLLLLSPSSLPPFFDLISPATFLALYYIDNFHPVRMIISSSRINRLLKYSKPLASRNTPPAPRLRTNFWYQRDPRTICIFLRHDSPAAQAGSNLCILLVNVIRFLRAAPRSAKAADKFFTNWLEASWPTSRPVHCFCPLDLRGRWYPT